MTDRPCLCYSLLERQKKRAVVLSAVYMRLTTILLTPLEISSVFVTDLISTSTLKARRVVLVALMGGFPFFGLRIFTFM